MTEGGATNGGAEGPRRLRDRLIAPLVRMRTSGLSSRFPRVLRSLAYALAPARRMEVSTWRAQYSRMLEGVESVPLRTTVTLGIIKDVAFKYGNYEAACRELGVPYKLLSITSDDWQRKVEDSGCAAFLAWPANINARIKKVFDERLRVLSEDMGRLLFPSYKALWLYESKMRQADWMTANGVPHPQTWTFFDRDEAMDFVRAADLPLVFKTDLGSAASGVEIVRTRRAGERLVRQCFGKGYRGWRHDPRDRHWGHILLQDFIEGAKEWRMIRIGDSFFGHQKLMEGDFHSGTHLVGWYRPPDRLLDLCRDVTDKGPFLSMDLDVLEDRNGDFLVNELQAVFGSINPSQMYVDGKPGRLVHDSSSGQWGFEEGLFCRSASCTPRVLTLLNLLGHPLPEEQ